MNVDYILFTVEVFHRSMKGAMFMRVIKGGSTSGFVWYGAHDPSFIKGE